MQILYYSKFYSHYRIIYTNDNYDTVYFKKTQRLMIEEYLQSIEKYYVCEVNHC